MKEFTVSKQGWMWKIYASTYKLEYTSRVEWDPNDVEWDPNDSDRYDLIIDDVMPQNYCPYFWKSMLAIAAFILLWPSYIGQWISNRNEETKIIMEFGLKWIVSLAFYAMVGMVYSIGSGLSPDATPWYLEFIIGTLMFISIAAIIWIFTIIKIYLSSKFTISSTTAIGRTISKWTASRGMLSMKLEAWYTGVCPKINWKD